MKKLKQCVGVLTGLLLLSCSNADRTVSKSTIDVAGAMENLQELKVSQLGSKIKFVPLETNDSTLVANHWNFLVTDKYVIVSNMGYGSSQKCMTFDLNTGKYIATVGHPGQDPEAYGNCIPIMDESGSDVLYFFTPKGRLVKYSMDGRFLGSINSKIANRRLTSYPLINDTVMTAVLSGSTLEGDRYISLLRMDLEMNLIDSIAVVTQGNPIDPYARIRYSEAFIQEHPSKPQTHFLSVNQRHSDDGSAIGQYLRRRSIHISPAHGFGNESNRFHSGSNTRKPHRPLRPYQIF